MSAMASGIWNGQVTGDVTWPWKVKVVTQIYLDANILKTVEDRDSVPIGKGTWQIENIINAYFMQVFKILFYLYRGPNKVWL